MRFTLTVLVIITILKNIRLLSDELFMETFQDGEFFDEISQIPVRHAEITASLTEI